MARIRDDRGCIVMLSKIELHLIGKPVKLGLSSVFPSDNLPLEKFVLKT
jgi:hypothetical protein